MARQQKLGAPQGGQEWMNLESIGDVRRFLRWLIIGTAAGKLDTRTAAVLGQLACYIQRAIEGGEVERRLEEAEKKLEGNHSDLAGHTTLAH